MVTFKHSVKPSSTWCILMVPVERSKLKEAMVLKNIPFPSRQLTFLIACLQ